MRFKPHLLKQNKSNSSKGLNVLETCFMVVLQTIQRMSSFLQLSLTLSVHVFFSCPLLQLPSMLSSLYCFKHKLFCCTCPNHDSAGTVSDRSRRGMPRYLHNSSMLTLSEGLTTYIHLIIQQSFHTRCNLSSGHCPGFTSIGQDTQNTGILCLTYEI